MLKVMIRLKKVLKKTRVSVGEFNRANIEID